MLGIAVQLMELSHLTADDLAYPVPYQPNKRIMDTPVKKWVSVRGR